MRENYGDDPYANEGDGEEGPEWMRDQVPTSDSERGGDHNGAESYEAETEEGSGSEEQEDSAEERTEDPREVEEKPDAVGRSEEAAKPNLEACQRRGTPATLTPGPSAHDNVNERLARTGGRERLR